MLTKKNNAITGFRGLVVFLIVFRHYSARYSELFQGDISITFPFSTPHGGTIGNIIFMMMMGFFMSKSLLANSFGIKEVCKYVINRYWRFWPTYAAAVFIITIVLFFFPLPNRSPDILTSVVDFFFIIHPKFDNIDGSHWFLTTILIIQIVLSLVLLIRHIHVRKYMIMSLTVIAMVYVIMEQFGYKIHSDYSEFVFFAFIILVGILFYLFKNIKEILFIYIVTMIVISVHISLFAIIIPVAILLAIFVLLIKCPRYFKLFEYNPFKFVGNLSFQWYLVHQNVGFAIMYYFLPKGELSLIWLLIPMSITLFMAYVINVALKNVPSKIIK